VETAAAVVAAMGSTVVVSWAVAAEAAAAEAAADSEAADSEVEDSAVEDSAVEDLDSAAEAVEDSAVEDLDSAVEDLDSAAEAADSEVAAAADLPRESRPSRDPRHCRSRSIQPQRVVHHLKSRQRHQICLLQPRRLCRLAAPSQRRASNSSPGRTGKL
jgi:hypothetical protein